VKMGPHSLVNAENESWRAKHENEAIRPQYRQKRVRERKTLKRDLTPSLTPKTSPGAQYVKTRPDVNDTAENESGSAKR
jgi:hypothetical protein